MKSRGPHLHPGRAAEPRSPEPRPEEPEPTEVVYGLRAGLAVFTARPADIVRIGFSTAAYDEIPEVVDLAGWAEAEDVQCSEMSTPELDRAAGTPHHEGLIVLARARKWVTPKELGERLVARKGAAVALDRVRNPQNIGAVLRSAAFFGFDAALLGAPAPHPGLAPAAIRVAEGGVEHLAVSRTTDLADTLGRLRERGVQIVGADGEAKQSAFGFAFRRPTMLVLGHEREGLGDRIRAQCDAIVRIPGSGKVESLNVGVAAGVLLAEVFRSLK